MCNSLALTLACVCKTRVVCDVLVVDGAGGVARFDYDARGRLAAQTMPGERTTTFECGPTGHLDRMVDPVGVSSTWTRDATGLPVAFEVIVLIQV